MKSNVLQYLDRSVAASPEKTAVLDDRTRYTYRQMDELRRRIGTALCGLVPPGSPVGVYMDKCADAIAVFLGVVSAGCFYSVLNPELPPQRLGQIAAVLEPGCIVTTRESEAAAGAMIPAPRRLTLSAPV